MVVFLGTELRAWCLLGRYCSPVLYTKPQNQVVVKCHLSASISLSLLCKEHKAHFPWFLDLCTGVLKNLALCFVRDFQLFKLCDLIST
jgi:hypothetical protein